MSATTTPITVAQASQQESQQEGRHLLVLNHGLWGNAGHVKFIADQFKERLGDRLLVVSISFLSPFLGHSNKINPIEHRFYQTLYLIPYANSLLSQRIVLRGGERVQVYVRWCRHLCTEAGPGDPQGHRGDRVRWRYRGSEGTQAQETRQEGVQEQEAETRKTQQILLCHRQ